MKKTTFILMIMTALLASTVFADAPFDVTNPSFEDATGGVCDFWTLWSGGTATESVYHEGDSANANTGDDYFEVGNGGAGWSGIHTDLGQEVAVTPGTDVEMVVFAKTADGSAQTGSVIMKLEFYAFQSEGWDEGPYAELVCDTTGSYQWFSLVTEVPAGMIYARATIVSTGINVYVDDVWVGQPGTPCGAGPCNPDPMFPDPARGSIQTVTNAPAYGYTPVTDLSWINPGLADDSTLGSSADLGIEVKFGVGTADPNFPGASTYSVAAGSGSAFETVALSALSPVPTLPLADDTDYYWQVIVTDANSAGPVVREGIIWTFETGDVRPIIQAPAGAYMWLDQEDGDGDPTIRTFTVTTTYTDDGKSAIVDANFITNDWLWEDGDAGVIEVSNVHAPDPDDPTTGAKSGTVVATYKTVALGDDPSRPTEETIIPGWWNFALEVYDAAGARTTSGATGYHYIGTNCGDAAAAGGDLDFEASDGAYDVNDDCIINLADFAALAAKWLDQSSKYE